LAQEPGGTPRRGRRQGAMAPPVHRLAGPDPVIPGVSELARTVLAGYSAFPPADAERRCRELLRTVLALAPEEEGEEPQERAVDAAGEKLWDYPVPGQEEAPPDPTPPPKGKKGEPPPAEAPSGPLVEARHDPEGAALLLSHAWDAPKEWDTYFSQAQPFAVAKQLQAVSGIHLAAKRQLSRKGVPPRAWLDVASFPDGVSADDHPVSQVSWGPFQLPVEQVKDIFPKVQKDDGYTILQLKEPRVFEGVKNMRKFDDDNRPMRTVVEEPVKWEIPAGWFYVRSARVIPEDKISPDFAASKAAFRPQQEQIRRWCTKLALRDEVWVEFTLGTIRTEVLLLMEPMISLHGGMVPIFTWNYFDRLWPLCEWALFCAHRGPQHISLAADAFYSAANVEYHRAIRRVSVTAAEVRDWRDREILLAQLEQTFACDPQGEIQNFRKPAAGILIAAQVERVVDWAPLERYLRATAIACFAREAALAHTCKLGSDDEGGWIELANELGLEDLLHALKRSKPYYWAEAAAARAGAGEDGDEEGAYNELVEAWWFGDVLPVLEAERRLALRGN